MLCCSRHKIQFLEPRADWEARFGPIYSSFPTIRDGVPELLAEGSFRKNLMGDESDAMLYAERNNYVIKAIFDLASDKTCDVLVKRMKDANLKESVHCCMRQFWPGLTTNEVGTFCWPLQTSRINKLAPARVVLPGNRSRCDATKGTEGRHAVRAEQAMVALVSNRKPVKLLEGANTHLYRASDKLTVADATASFSDIPSALITHRFQSRLASALAVYRIKGTAKSRGVANSVCIKVAAAY